MAAARSPRIVIPTLWNRCVRASLAFSRRRDVRRKWSIPPRYALPGYDLAFFSLLGRLPYGIAKALWYLSLFASLLVAAFAIARLTRFPIVAVVAFLASVDGVLNFTYGQLPPIVVAALALSAYLLERRRYVWSAIIASISMLEPNLGLPASSHSLFGYRGRA